MIFGSLITAFVLIATGLIVKNNPDLIAGYNSLSDEEKDNIDTDKLTRLTRNYLVVLGLSVLIIEGVLLFLNRSEQTRIYSICGVIIFGITLLIVQSNRLSQKK